MSCLRKQFQDEMLYQKTLTNKNFIIFVSRWRFQHLTHILQNPKHKIMDNFSSNHSMDSYLPQSMGPCHILITIIQS